MASSSTAAAPEWQNKLRSRLMEQQAEGEVYREMIDQYRRLARTARDLKVRNRAMLRSGAGPSAGSDGSPSPLLAHLDAQLSTLRAELSQLYRTQAAAQNKQLSLSDALRDRDEEVRGLREEVRQLREAREGLLRREKEWDEKWKMRTRDMETLNDELLSLNLEITSLGQKNGALQADNASLLQRWLDKMNLTAEEMNVEFEKEAAEKPGRNTNEGSTSRVSSASARADAAAIVDASVAVESGGEKGEGEDEWEVLSHQTDEGTALSVDERPIPSEEPERRQTQDKGEKGELEESNVMITHVLPPTLQRAESEDEAEFGGWEEARKAA